MSNEKIYTIRISEAMEKKCGCPLCTVESDLQNDEVERILGASMMEPDVRVQTNAQGFCGKHLDAMLAKSNKLSLALMLKTHMEELNKKVFSDTVPMLSKTPDPKKQVAALTKKAQSCYLCGRVREFMNATYGAFVYMYKSMEDFEARLKDQPNICLRHTRLILDAAMKNLSKDQLKGFAAAVNEINTRYADSLIEDVDWFCKKFDYRYKDADWKNSKDSVERAVAFLK